MNFNGKYRNYPKESLIKAYEHVKTTDASVRKTAKQFGIPVQTLRDRVKEFIDPVNCAVRRDTIFSHEELALIEHVDVLSNLDYGATNSKLQQIVGEFAYAFGKRPTSKPFSNCSLYGFI